MHKISQFSLLNFLVMVFLVSCGGKEGNSPEIYVALNSAPTLSGSVSKIRVGEALNFTPSTKDVDGDRLSFKIDGKPSWAEFDLEVGLLSGIPSSDDLGALYPIKISVSDGQASNSISFDLTVTKPIFFLSVDISTLDAHRDMAVELSGCFIAENDSECSEGQEVMTISENGRFILQSGIQAGSNFELDVDRDPGRQKCFFASEESVLGYSDKTMELTCQADESAPLFSLERVHHIRLTMDINEWNAFVLDIARSNYSFDAHQEKSGLTKRSQVYRQVDFEYLDDKGNLIQKLEKVGFKMKGSTSRQWPEYYYEDASGEKNVKPKRFSFGLKFDEKFDEDESVYACIDGSGSPAAVSNLTCDMRLGKNLDEVIENSKREFMGLEKLAFRFNKHDPSYQRELIVHDILNSIGVPTSRVAHANVSLRLLGNGSFNGESLPQNFQLGIFQMVEPIDKPFLKRFFGKNGFLFKNGYLAYLTDSHESLWNCINYDQSSVFVNSNFCHIGIEKSDPDSREEWLGSLGYLNPQIVNSDIDGAGPSSQFKPYYPKYDLKSKKSKIAEGEVLLRDFILFLQTTPSASMLAEHFDVDGFIKAQAAEIVTGAADHYVRVGNNYYLYLNPTTNKWTYIPSDFDLVLFDNHSASWGEPPWGSIYRDLAATYAFPSSGKVDWASRTYLEQSEPILWDIVFGEESNKTLLYREIKSILDGYFDWGVVGKKLIERNLLVAELINQTEAGLPDGCEFIYNPKAINADENETLCDISEISIRQFIMLRREALYQELQENGL